MKSLPSINYVNHEGDRFGKLALIDIPAEVAAHAPWFNETLTTVNDAVVRLGIFQGDFHWHKHDEQDELFLVLEGEIYLDVEGAQPLLLRRNQGFNVPKGTCTARGRPKSRSFSWLSGPASSQPVIEPLRIVLARPVPAGGRRRLS